jgi:hypothetical protein
MAGYLCLKVRGLARTPVRLLGALLCEDGVHHG